MATRRSAPENHELNALELDVAFVDGGPRDRHGDPEQEFGPRLARLREGRALSQEQLSLMTKAHDSTGDGISRAVISMYERGRNKPGIRELRILCDTLTVSPAELVYGSTAPFDADRWQILDSNRGDALYFARWVCLLAKVDPTAQLSIYELVIALVRPTQKQVAALDAEARELFLTLAAELKGRRPATPKKPK